MRGNPWDDLPAEVAELKANVERLSGCEVYFQPTDDGAGHSTYQWIDEDIVVYVGEYSHAMAAEELLHIQMDIEGYPRLRVAGRSLHLARAATHLHNEIQHAVIFPKLEAMGYSPRTGECEAIANWVRATSAVLDSSDADARDPHFKALITMLYVRARRNCDLGACAELDRTLFDLPACAEAVAAGRFVMDLIANGPLTPVERYRHLMQQCLQVLDISHEVSFCDPRDNDDE